MAKITLTSTNILTPAIVALYSNVEYHRINESMFVAVLHEQKIVRFLNFSPYEPQKVHTKAIERIVYPLSSKGYTIE